MHASPGAVIALSADTFDEAVAIGIPVTIVGTCVASTILAPTVSVAVQVESPGVTLMNLQIASPIGAMAITETGGLVLEDAVIDGSGSVSAAISVSHGTFDARDVLVKNAGGGGLVLDSSRATIDGATFEANTGSAIKLMGYAGSATITDVAIVGTRPLSDPTPTSNVSATGDVRVHIERVLIEGSSGNGITVESGADGTIDQAYVHHLKPNATDHLGVAIGIWDGAHALVRNSSIADGGADGISVDTGCDGPITRAVFDRVSVSDIAGTPASPPAVGVYVRGSSISIVRSMLRRTSYETIYLPPPENGCVRPVSTVNLTDVYIDNPYRASDVVIGFRAIAANQMAFINATRLWVESRGVRTGGAGSSMSFSDLTIHGAALGGFDARGGAAIRLAKADIASSGLFGVCVEGGSSLDASDTTIRGTIADLPAVPNNPDCGGFFEGLGAGIRTTAGTLQLERFQLLGNASYGALLDADSAVTFQDGLVAENAIGARFAPDVDGLKLLSNVAYRDNPKGELTPARE
jgi:hypothetical protein